MQIIETVLGELKELLKEELTFPTHQCRMRLESLVLTYMRETYLPRLRDWWATYKVPKEAPRSIVIYETRSDPHLEFLFLNMCYFAQSWALTIYCFEENVAAIRGFLGHNADNANIHILPPIGPEGGRMAYNAFLTSRRFWEGLSQYEHVLLAELDSYLLDHIDKIPDLEEYDYIASAWIWFPEAPGGGGLSIRRVSKMLAICDLNLQIDMQDAWASEGIQQLGGCVNKTVFTESALLEHVYGTHQWWSFCFSWLPLLEETPQILQYLEQFFRLNL